MTAVFDRLDDLPPGFFEITTNNIRDLFPRPTLIHLRGDVNEVVFVSILLHGNESTGLDVMQNILQKYAGQLPRSILLFIGNVRAAEANRRFLPDQTDYNRCWPGTELETNAACEMMASVTAIAKSLPLFAALDIHNNTGKNPHYACITDDNMQNRSLAARFNRVAMVFNKKGVSTMAFDGVCPAMTIECGVPGDPDGIQHACRIMHDLLTLEEIPNQDPAHSELHLVESHATLNIPENVSFAFDARADADLLFDSDFENRNFTLVDPDQILAYTRIERPLTITDQEGHDITDDVVRIDEGRIYLNQTMMPAMISQNKEVVRQDCLCYLMQDYHGQEFEA
ncbi:MAG: M14 family metallopeptidase [Pseudomonadota bacterium]